MQFAAFLFHRGWYFAKAPHWVSAVSVPSSRIFGWVSCIFPRSVIPHGRCSAHVCFWRMVHTRAQSCHWPGKPTAVSANSGPALGHSNDWLGRADVMGVTLIIIKRNREYTPLFSVLMPGGLVTLDIIIVIVIIIKEEHEVRVSVFFLARRMDVLGYVHSQSHRLFVAKTVTSGLPRESKDRASQGREPRWLLG